MLMNGIFNGFTGPVGTGWKVRWSPTTGGESEIRSAGFDPNAMLALAGQQAALGISCELSFSHNMAELVLRTSNPTYQGFGNVFNTISDKWEIATDDERPSLFENPSYLSIFDTANALYGVSVDSQFAQIIKQNAESGSNTWYSFSQLMSGTNLTSPDGLPYLTNPSDDTTTVSLYHIFTNYLESPAFQDTLSGELGLKFFAEEYFRGRTNYLHSKYTLKHTTLAPDTYSSNVAEFNIEQIYSIAQLLTEVQSNTLWILPLPGYLAYKILNYPVPIGMPSNYTWGALKMRSNAVTAARGRIEMTQSYLIDAVAVPTYGVI